MDCKELKNIWDERYAVVPQQLEKLKTINSVATAFNTNIDAIYKISGEQLKKIITENGFTLSDIENISLSGFREPRDVVLGIAKCFCRGIAEEWVTEDISVYNWLNDKIGYQRLQMGGQGGIIANALALLQIGQVVAHTNSHPKLQAEQFLDLDNLLSFDENGKLAKSVNIARNNDIPLIHWIIEFDKNDTFTLEGKTFTCPKSNRFIATYDPLNMNLVMNEDFISYLSTPNNVEYLLLSGFNPLLESNNGIALVDNAAKILEKWKTANKDMIVHLEIASTQDKAVRKAIAQKLAPLSHSVGLNERETIDLLEIMDKNDLAQVIEKDTSACNLFDAVLYLIKELRCQRIQLHMFGLYLTIQNKDFRYSAEQNLKGMVTASVVSSSKAYNGEITEYEHLTKALGMSASDIGLNELKALADKLSKPELLEKGICEVDGYTVSAIPTILVDKPKTLVGMGDTISSVSLLAGL